MKLSEKLFYFNNFRKRIGVLVFFVIYRSRSILVKGYLSDIRVGDGVSIRILGVINLSVGSFYSKSVRTDLEGIVKLALEHVEEGADIVDIGAVSSAPPSVYGDSKPVSKGEETERIIRAVKALNDASLSVPISVDTMNSEVAENALKLDVPIINDISGFKRDPLMAKVVADYGASAIVMATRVEPGDVYILEEIKDALFDSLQIAEKAGLDVEKMVVDPGIGRWGGREAFHDLVILDEIDKFREVDRPVLVSISRKSFIGGVLNRPDPEDRLFGSLAATAIAVYKGAHVIRTHDVSETLDAIKVAHAIKKRQMAF
jgi:dihydropteroate synthase